MVFGRKDDDGESKMVEISTVGGAHYRISAVPPKTIGKMETGIRWANLPVLKFPVKEGGALFFPIASIDMFFIRDGPVDVQEGDYTYLEGDEDEE